jgi:hypothetical protein
LSKGKGLGAEAAFRRIFDPETSFKCLPVGISCKIIQEVQGRFALGTEQALSENYDLLSLVRFVYIYHQLKVCIYY